MRYNGAEGLLIFDLDAPVRRGEGHDDLRVVVLVFLVFFLFLPSLGGCLRVPVGWGPLGQLFVRLVGRRARDGGLVGSVRFVSCQGTPSLVPCCADVCGCVAVCGGCVRCRGSCASLRARGMHSIRAVSSQAVPWASTGSSMGLIGLLCWVLQLMLQGSISGVLLVLSTGRVCIPWSQCLGVVGAHSGGFPYGRMGLEAPSVCGAEY
mmetsp:Transcript_18473/g.52144  ORF Transcript_18473/g.52144 Transcript_18473/m.52144 type:complete len:207 (-) Transcript_18473:181-801(-)